MTLPRDLDSPYILWTNVRPLDVEVHPAPIRPFPTIGSEAPMINPHGRSLADVWRLLPYKGRRAPFAGKDN
jgi:hypothetical protein